MKRNNQGFTLIELLVTLILGTALIVAFFTLYRTGLAINTNAARKETAKNIAYKELRRYSETLPSTWSFNCTTALSANGQVFTQTITSSGLPTPATLTVKATAPFGCQSPNTDMPVLIESSVTYGPSAEKVVYSTYAKK